MAELENSENSRIRQANGLVDFKVVKKITRDSFREDQALLNKKLNVYNRRKLSPSSSSSSSKQRSGTRPVEETPVKTEATNERLSIDDSDVGSTKGTPTLNGHVTHYEKAKWKGSHSGHLDKIISRSARNLNMNSIRNFERANEFTTVAGAEVELIPPDGSLRSFTPEQMTTVFRMLNFNEDLVERLRHKNIDGKKFAMFKDKDLELMGIKNPVVCYFRDRSMGQTSKSKKPGPFLIL